MKHYTNSHNKLNWFEKSMVPFFVIYSFIRYGPDKTVNHLKQKVAELEAKIEKCKTENEEVNNELYN